jgi:hypothetical protein
MYLNATTDKLEIFLGGTVATSQLQWNVSYQDITSSGMTLPQAAGAGNTNNTTVVDIVAAPAASTTRQVTHINVFNADTATATVSIQKDVSGTNYVLISYSVVSGDTLMWSREDGWRLMSAAGGAIVLTGDVTGTGTSSIATTIANDAVTTVKILNDAVTYAKIQNVSAASRLLGRGSAGGSGDVEEVTLGTNLSMSGTTLNATGGGVSAIGTINSQTKSANGAVISGTDLVMQTADATNPGLVSTGTQTIAGNKTITGESATVGNVLVVQNLTPTAKLTVANAGRVTVGQDSTVTTEVCAVITTDVTNANLVLAPNGTGAIIADIPDGAVTGGNARGDNAVDLQMSRTSANQVASGFQSVLFGGTKNTSSGTGTVVLGGDNNTASGAWAVDIGGRDNSATGGFGSVTIGGQGNTASGNGAVTIGGFRNASTTEASVSQGTESRAYLYSQRAHCAGAFGSSNSTGDAQNSTIIFRRSITGTAITELFLDGASIRAILALPTGATNARAWRAQIDVVAICATAGGTTVLNDVFAGSYHCAIKRVGTTTSLVGAVSVTNEVSDTSMSTSVVTIDANDTNEALRIQFTPPTTADGTTVVRVVATAYLTEVGR